MPLTDGPTFSTRRDLHLLRGDPPVALWKLLSVSFGSGNGRSGIRHVRYLPCAARRRRDPAAACVDFDEVGTRLVGLNIGIDQSTGMLRALKPQPPEPAVHNFVIGAIVTEERCRSFPSGRPAAFASTYIRASSGSGCRRAGSRFIVPRRPATEYAVRVHRPRGVRRWHVSRHHDHLSLPRGIRSTPSASTMQAKKSGLVKLPASMGPGSVRTLSVGTTPEWNSRAAHADVAVIEPWETACCSPRPYGRRPSRRLGGNTQAGRKCPTSSSLGAASGRSTRMHSRR